MRDDSAELEGSVTRLTPASAGDSNSASAQASPVQVYCLPLPGEPGQFQEFAVSMPEAKFESMMIAPGTYHLLAFRREHRELPFRDAEAMSAYDGKGAIVHLSAGQKTNVQVPIIPGDEPFE